MATSTINSITTKGYGKNNGQGAGIYCYWERVGDLVTVTGMLSHENESWTIFYDIPPARIESSIDGGGVIIGRLSNGHDIYVTHSGVLQDKSASYSTRYNFSGSYICGV